MIVLADSEETSQRLINTKVIVNAKVQGEAQILELNVLRCFKYCIILGLPWLRKKSPQINWKRLEICSADANYVVESKPTDSLPKHETWDYNILLLLGDNPVWKPLYPMSKNQLKEVQTYLDENLKKGFIQPSKSPAEYSILFVPKKDDWKWLCVDYCQLNDITRRDSYPLPLIKELQDRLGTVQWFMSLDIEEAYYWVRMKEGEEWKTAFQTRYGHYKYTVMPFGLKNAPATFQQLINNTVREYLNKFVITYLNDILIYSDTLEEHWQHMPKVLEKLSEKTLYIKKEKSRFEVQEVKFLGYVIWPEQIEKDPKKTQAVRDWSTLRRVKKVQSFLGLANYYQKFIPNYSWVAESLTHLMWKAEEFHWNKEQKQAFQDLKNALSRMTHLQIPKTTCEKVVETDVSDFVVGACLYQIKDDEKQPIMYQSRKLSGSEKRYEVHNKELLVIVKALQEWRSYLAGLNRSIQIYTDHKNLQNFVIIKELNWWQVRWAEQLADYEFQIHYKKDNENGGADVLSQQPDHKGVKKIHQEILWQNAEEVLMKDLAATFCVELPQWSDEKIIRECHKSRTAGHFEVKQTENLVQWRCSIVNCREWIIKMIAKCDSCWQNRISRDKRYDEIKQLEVSENPWESVTMNFIVKTSPLKDPAWGVRFNSILMIVDWLTKYTMFISFRESATAPVLVYIILQELVSNHRLSKEFITDWDKLFTSKFWKTLTPELGIQHKLFTAYHSQTDGQIKRMNQTVETYLQHYVSKTQENWVQLLSTAQFAYNNARNEITGVTSFYTNYRYNSEVWREQKDTSIKSQQAKIDISELKKLHQDLVQMLQAQPGRTMMVTPYRVGEKIYLWTDNIKIKWASKKLDHQSIGPFMIKRNIKDLSYELDLSVNMRIHPVFHAFMLQSCDQFILLQTKPTPVEPDEEYEVERILGKKMISGTAHYLVKWKGYDTSELTWEPKTNLKNCTRMLQQFEEGRWK